MGNGQMHRGISYSDRSSAALTSNALANLSSVSVVTTVSGFRQIRLMVLMEMSDRLERLEIVNPFASATSFTRNRIIHPPLAAS